MSPLAVCLHAQLLCGAAIAGAGDAAQPVTGADGTRAQAFRTAVEPWLDPLFPGPQAVAADLESFAATQAEMLARRDDFSAAVHETLAVLPARRPGSVCPLTARRAYQRAHAAGASFLALGHRLRELHRRVGRAEALGETATLPPDLRLRARQIGQQYAERLRDFREMRVVFHEQLATELRYAGCSQRELLAAPRQDEPPAGSPRAAASADRRDEPEDPGAWPEGGSSETAEDAAGAVPARTTGPNGAFARTAGAGAADAGKAIWIEIDNRRCAQPGRLAIDGVPLGELPPGQRVQVRARAGMRTLCILAAQDVRACGERGTLRSTYLYEGLSLSVRCGP